MGRLEGTEVVHRTVFPKAITSKQLFGYVNKTFEFVEGVVSLTMREYLNNTSSALKYLVFDGPVDTMWIENMNSVLDDTKKLCLENSDLIRLDNKTAVIFEVDDLAEASLATISRCGMVYNDRANTDDSVFFRSWLANLPTSYLEKGAAELLQTFYTNLFEIIVREKLFDQFDNFLMSSPIPVFKGWLIRTFITLLEGLFFSKLSKEDIKEREEMEKAEQEKNKKDSLFTRKPKLSKKEKIDFLNKFVFAFFTLLNCLISSEREKEEIEERAMELIGDMVNQNNFEYREEVNELIKNMLGKKMSRHVLEEDKWVDLNYELSDLMKGAVDKLVSRETLLIPTESILKAEFIFGVALAAEVPVCLVGPSGSGKTLLMKEMVQKFSVNKGFSECLVILNSKTSANNLCDLLEEKINFKLKKNTYAPPDNKECLLVVDDLNMPLKEKYKAQPPIEVVRQLLDKGGWLERKEMGELQFKNLHLVANLTEGRDLVSSRLLWRFLPVLLPDLTRSEMTNMFSTLYSANMIKYPPTVRKLGNSVTKYLIFCYFEAFEAFKPYPSTPHYAFNIRDLKKTLDDLLLVEPEVCAQATKQNEVVYKQIAHSLQRVYVDRLVTLKEKETLLSYFTTEMEHYCKVEGWKDLMFSKMNDDTRFKQVTKEEIAPKVEEMLVKYNSGKRTKDKIDLIMFDYALKHMLRLERLLLKPNENGLLVGLTGSGRHSLAKLAAFACKIKVGTVRSKEEVDEYDHKAWLEDLRSLYISAGTKKEPTVFLIRDSELNNEQCYVDLNCLISSGFVYNLFSAEDKIEAVNQMRSNKEISEDMSDNKVWTIFMDEVKLNLKVVLLMNPLDSAFSKRLRTFPAFVNLCSIDWYDNWPEEALYFLAKRELSATDLSDSQQTNLSEIFASTFLQLTDKTKEYCQKTRKTVVLLPKMFLDFNRFFISFYKEEAAKNNINIKKYSDGVSKIESAGVEIEKMTKKLEISKPQLIEKNKFMEQNIKVMDQQTKEVTASREICMEKDKETSEAEHAAEFKKQVAEYNMNEANVIKQDIVAKIKSIEKKQYMDIRSYNKPPKEIVKMVRAIVIITNNFERKPLKKVPEDWAFFKKKLNDVKFLNYLTTIPTKLEKKLLNENTLGALIPYIEDPDLEPARMGKKISSACEKFCVYIKNIHVLDGLLKEKINPSIKASEEANASLEEARSNSAAVRASLAEIEKKLEDLTAEFNQKNLEKKQLDFEINDAKNKLNRAERLSSKLSGEKKRWSDIAKELKANEQFLFGNSIVASIYITFLSPFLSFFRKDFLVETVFPLLSSKQIEFRKETSLTKSVGEPHRLQEWAVNGLPSDTGSQDNAIVLFRTKKSIFNLEFRCLLTPRNKALTSFLSYTNSILPCLRLKLLKLNWNQLLRLVKSSAQIILTETFHLN